MRWSKKCIIDIVLITITSFCYLLNNCYVKKTATGPVHYFFTGYFNDLICPLFLLSYSNIMLGFVNRRIVKLFHILFMCFLCGLVWEGIAPLLKENSVADIFDIFCYCVGGVAYWIIQREKNDVRHKI